MFLPNDCDVKQIFRNDFVDKVNSLVNGTDYYTFQLYCNANSQGPNWYNQSIHNQFIKSDCNAREYLAFIKALDNQIKRESVCIVVYIVNGGTCDDDCIWLVCAE